MKLILNFEMTHKIKGSEKMIYLVGGAPLNENWLKSLEDRNILWVGVDGGTMALLDAGFHVTHAFGDFDSVSKEEFNKISSVVESVHTAIPEKNETDMEMALNWAIQQNQSVRIIGATGGRLDHFMGNVQLISSPHVMDHSFEVEIFDEQNRIRMLSAGKWETSNDESFPYLSFIPVTPEVKGLTLKGVKYPLYDHDLTFGSTLTVSNEFIEAIASISFRTGILMMIRSKDK